MDTYMNNQKGNISIRPYTALTPQETETLQIQEEGKLVDKLEELSTTGIVT